MRANIVVVYLVITALCWQFELTNSRTSTMWKLDPQSGKITRGRVRYGKISDSQLMYEAGENVPLDATEDAYEHDEIFYIIASTMTERSGSGWIRQSSENSIETLMMAKYGNMSLTKNETTEDDKNFEQLESSLVIEDTLDCGSPANYSLYDYLVGISQRLKHPNVAEPEVAYFFLKSKDINAYKNFDLAALERRLKRAKRLKPESLQLYIQLGNYWRIIGNTRLAIECFRHALTISPANSEVLLNMARVLYNLQYLDDAIHLTRKSLELQPSGRSAWQHYFTLGQIFKSYGHFQESIFHLRHAAELYPQFEPILRALHEVENSPGSVLHVYTVVIIVALVIAVFIVVLTSSSNDRYYAGGGLCQYDEPKTQRHFNRAMAMRSLKGLSTARNYRHRRN